MELVTSRLPKENLYLELADAGLPSLTCIGDCLAPATIAAAVYEGHRYARELDEDIDEDRPFLREVTTVL